jgi:ABC-type uncharacterized transport system ATPase subunit
MTADGSPLFLEMRGITKVYPNGVTANRDAFLRVGAGEIHALTGENGAGKSTLMKILFGMEQPDAGTIELDGRRVAIRSQSEAMGLGIGMVQQHCQQVPSMTVAENLVLGREPRSGVRFDGKKAVELCREMCEKYQFDLDPCARAGDISISQRQKLEILKALRGGARLLILDEPTAVLTPQETEEFFRRLRALREQGHTIIFISHRLRELAEVCDRMTVMRDGRTVGEYDVAECDEQRISRLIVGRDVALTAEKTPPKPGKNVLAVKDLTVTDGSGRAAVDGVSFSVRAGEIVGVAAVEGNGEKELVEAVTGSAAYAGGSIRFNGTETGGLSAGALRAMGMGFIPEDRIGRGTAPDSSVQDNLVALIRRRPDICRRGFMRREAIRREYRRMADEYEIKAPDGDAPVRMLSGGNMQKVAVARELDAAPSLLVAQQPTRGVDVGSVEFIHRQLVRMRDCGCAVLLISAELGELLTLSDALIVMHGGRIIAYFADTAGVTESELGKYMLGLETQSRTELGRAYHEE